MYEVQIERTAQKQLRKIPAPHFNRIIKAILHLVIIPVLMGLESFPDVTVIGSASAITELFI